MSAHPDLWRVGPGRALSSERGGLRLLVQPLEAPGGPVRFAVLRAGDTVGSGTRADVRTAMAAAARMAERLAVHSARLSAWR